MVLDLAGKFADTQQPTVAKNKSTTQGNQDFEEAMEALLALGYKAKELKKIRAFFEGTQDTAENYIKAALKMLIK